MAWPSSSEVSLYCALSAPPTSVLAPGFSVPSRSHVNLSTGLPLHAPLAQVSVLPADALPLGAARLSCGKGGAGTAAMSSCAVSVAAELISSSLVTSLKLFTVVPRTSTEEKSSDPTVTPLKLVSHLTVVCAFSSAPRNRTDTSASSLTAMERPPASAALTWHWMAWPSSSEASVYCALSTPGTSVLAPGISAPFRSHVNLKFGLRLELALQLPLVHVSDWPASGFPAILGAPLRSGVKTSKVPICEGLRSVPSASLSFGHFASTAGSRRWAASCSALASPWGALPSSISRSPRSLGQNRSLLHACSPSAADGEAVSPGASVIVRLLS